MKTACVGYGIVLLTGAVLFSGTQPVETTDVRELPPPKLAGSLSFEEVIAQRRSLRRFSETPLSAEQIGQLCWAGQGITDKPRGFRTSPSAGALYPIELYLMTDRAVEHYLPRSHSLRCHLAGDQRIAVQQAALGQKAVGYAPACIVVTAVIERTAGKYGERAERYCLLEAGHVAQNILLQATALGLAGVPIGAFNDEEVARRLQLPPGCHVLYLLPIGKPIRQEG